MNKVDIPRKITFKGKNSGPALLIFGAIHGDEVSGPNAIEKIIDKFKNKHLYLKKGSVTFVPICNPQAYDLNKRYVEENLNRVFTKTTNPKTYEARLANILCTYADTADILLDIHSTFADGPVNVFVDYPTEKNKSLAEALCAEYTIFDWPKAYKNNPYKLKSYTTDKYMHNIGKSGIVLECGQHNDLASILVAEKSIIRILSYLEMIPMVKDTNITSRSKQVKMNKIYVKNGENDCFTKNWRHLELIPDGTVIATRENGDKILAEKNSVILFPKTYAKIREEWFYLGESMAI